MADFKADLLKWEGVMCSCPYYILYVCQKKSNDVMIHT